MAKIFRDVAEKILLCPNLMALVLLTLNTSCIRAPESASHLPLQFASLSSTDKAQGSISDLDVNQIMPRIQPKLSVPGPNAEIMLSIDGAPLTAAQAPTAVRSNPAQSNLVQFVIQNEGLQLNSLPNNVVRNAQAFAQMKAYFSNLYSNLKADKTITVGRATFACIAINEQPTLRNGAYTLDTPPGPDDPHAGHSILGYVGMDCPKGDIPLDEISVTEMSQFANLRAFLSKSGATNNGTGNQNISLDLPPRPTTPRTSGPVAGGVLEDSDNSVHRWALLEQDTNANGLTADLDIWSPPVSGSDMSLSQTWIVGGADDSQQQTLESGWQVEPWTDPVRAVPFVYSVQAGYTNSGCYDLQCVDFVQVTNQIIFAAFPASGYSKAGGKQSILSIRWLRKSNGNWWLKINGVWVGFYPKKLFGNGVLASDDPGVRLMFGGENTGTLPSLPMGSGEFAAEGYGRAAFQSNLSFFDAHDKLNPIIGSSLESWRPCYSIENDERFRTHEIKGTFIFFGGPGTTDQTCARSFAPPTSSLPQS